MLLEQNIQTLNGTVNKSEKDASLSSYSKKDKKWDKKKAQNDDIREIYQKTEEFQKLAFRMSTCAEVLKFAWGDDESTGETKLRLREARFCRARYCTICQWRKSKMQQARFINAIPYIIENFPDSRWLLLTLTVKNCHITNLRETLKDMNAGWNRLRLRPELKQARGWIRATEVTRGKTDKDTAHPHFHTLLMVPPSMMGGRNYVTQSRWQTLWQECARLDYSPVVDIRAIKKSNKNKDITKDLGLDPDIAEQVNAVMGGALEVLKYAVKPDDFIDETGDPSWFLELTRQTHKLRFMAAGGVLKNALRDVEAARDEDMIHTDENEETEENQDDGERIAFNFRRDERIYRRYSHGDRSAKV